MISYENQATIALQELEGNQYRERIFSAFGSEGIPVKVISNREEKQNVLLCKLWGRAGCYCLGLSLMSNTSLQSRCPVNREAPLPFPGNRQEVAPVSRKELALVLTTLMAAGKCKLWSDESIFLFPFGCVVCLCNRGIGNGMGMGILPLFMPKLAPYKRFVADLLATAAYVAIIAATVNGWQWYVQLALPIIALAGIIFGDMEFLFGINILCFREVLPLLVVVQYFFYY